MIITVTLSPSLDRTIEIPALDRGGVIRATTSSVEAGGKGVNVSRALLANGHDRRAVLQGFVDVLSADDSEELTRLLRKAQGGRQRSRDKS